METRSVLVLARFTALTLTSANAGLTVVGCADCVSVTGGDLSATRVPVPVLAEVLALPGDFVDSLRLCLVS